MKKLMTLAASFLVLFLAGSCATTALARAITTALTTTVWDDSLPPEKSATLTFYNIQVASYNGIKVEKWRTVVIPPGETAIFGTVDIQHGGITFVTRNMEFTCYLEAGKKYSVRGAAADRKWGVNLYVHENSYDRDPEFIPFKNQPEIR
jgi:hypothetical protein